MRNIVHNEKGVTLVEILAAIVLTALVATLIFNVQASSYKQYDKQLDQNQQLNEVSYVLKVITKEMRKTTDITPISDGIKIKDIEYRFDASTNSITKNTEPFATNIGNFHVKYVDNSWNIKIKNLDGKMVETKIVVRSGS
ncbi:prepilin-type N-terminal cleavage/methylation domain-containing protein [Viridibacillus sp. YIM B01967]|uniref:Prepilin-type N-terminal cleavage/methylation domain-containing protein n=1 Tax=Viridibacillus soli TaxID=2798301 RepID=A0ABS1H213_9BACL|nr:prepilin-type N-terminal cleavage/methylation domain-containing protein [Viridibacillus soli]MBK3493449.1 prepilin-type N-terminal cleavage/methylation domain-containing protein [Viridibacillus soli]